MISEQLASIEAVGQQIARRRFGPDAARPTRLLRRVVQTSRRYNEERPLAGGLDPLDPVARFLFYTMADLAKLPFVLAELHASGRLKPGSLRVLDVGAGFGAMTLGLLAVAPSLGLKEVHVTAVDRDEQALEILAETLEGCRKALGLGPHVALQTRAMDFAVSELNLGELDLGTWDLTVAGSVLNELSGADALRLAQNLTLRLNPTGHLVIIEPALRRTTRALHRLRDRLLGGGSLNIAGPCTHSRTCPMLASPRDWCHERRPWSAPPGVRAVTRASGLRRGDLKWAYLALTPALSGQETGSSVSSAQRYRVVSDPMVSKGKLEIYLCGELGRFRAVRLKRDRSDLNREFKYLRRGWIAHIERARADGAVLPIGPLSRVTAQDPTLNSL